MNFRETLGRHLLAIETRDLETLAATVADPLVLIMADGKREAGRDLRGRRTRCRGDAPRLPRGR